MGSVVETNERIEALVNQLNDKHGVERETAIAYVEGCTWAYYYKDTAAHHFRWKVSMPQGGVTLRENGQNFRCQVHLVNLFAKIIEEGRYPTPADEVSVLSGSWKPRESQAPQWGGARSLALRAASPVAENNPPQAALQAVDQVRERYNQATFTQKAADEAVMKTKRAYERAIRESAIANDALSTAEARLSDAFAEASQVLKKPRSA